MRTSFGVGRASWSGFLLLAALVPIACAGPVATAQATPSPTANVVPATPAPTSETAAAPTSSAPASPSAATSLAPGADAAGIVWLCMPGKPDSPCEGSLTTTVIDPKGKRTVETIKTDPNAPIDCFFVYPTTSQQAGPNADLSIDPEEKVIATTEVSAFSQVCKVYAPIYPQITIPALGAGRVSADAVAAAYSGLVAGFDDYLANYNHGRGIVLIGHSQGAMHLISLLEDRFDNDPAVRKLLVSALLLGGNATTAPGQATGGGFANIPTCGSPKQTGCVVGYSSFAQEPPDGAGFARVSSGFGFGRPPRSGEQIMCVNPTALGGKGIMKPMITPSDLVKFTKDVPNPLPSTTFISYANAYAAECKTSGDATWLEVSRLDPKAVAPVVHTTEGDDWGLHDLDVSLPMGNLIDLVRAQTTAYKP